MKTTPKDFFMHLGATIALYVSVVALLNLYFSVIDYFTPDSLAYYYYDNSVAWPISTLVVLVPLLYIIGWFIKKGSLVTPAKKDIWIYRWRIYLTLFLTGATFVTDIIVLINTYLNGEISARFVYKVLIVLVVSSVIFTYYILERSVKSINKMQNLVAGIGIVLVMAGIIMGFISVGSPAKQRSLRFDNQRIADLSNIQWQIVNYWQLKAKLPTTFSDLNDPISGFIFPRDPDNNLPYEYVKTGDKTFKLCANFYLESQKTNGINQPVPYKDPSGVDSNWSHSVGRACFDRTIDSERYPLLKN